MVMWKSKHSKYPRELNKPISNLPYYKYILVHKMKRLDTSKYDKKQLEDFSVYVFGLPYEILHSMGVR